MNKYKRIFFSPPHTGGEELKFIQDAFASNYIAPLGPMVNAFEREFAKKVGIPNAVAVASGTAAMPWWNSFTSVKLASHFTG
jgi:dTDP-4-amino-4,6-dideoxygalactose transaminase